MHSYNHVTIPNPSISNSWSSMLYNILRYPPLTPQASIRTRLRHSGNIWKRLTSMSIYHDLASILTIHYDNATSMTRTLRRFVRLEHIGLSGVILYEIRTCSPYPFYKGDGIDIAEYLTMQSVFGNPISEVAADHSMDLDDLLDAVDAKMVHFPSYACTSFIVGQVMNAYLTNRHELTPIPAPSGFSILCSGSSSAIFTAASPTQESGRRSASNISMNGAPMQYFPYSDNLQEAFSLREDDPHLSLCIRSSSLDSSGVIFNANTSRSGDSDEEVGDTGDSTTDSLGPCTPPRLSCKLPSGKGDAASTDLADFLSASLLNLIEEDELTSFIDFTGSFFENVDFDIIINDTST